MKKILTGALAFVLFAGAARAQSSPDSSRFHHRAGNEMRMNSLNLTADQKAKLKAIHQQERQEMQSLSTTSLTADQLKTKRQELHQKYSEQMQSVLSPEQRQQWEKNRAEWKTKGKAAQKEGETGARNARGFYGRNDIVKQLNLSQEQQDKLAQIRKNGRTQFESIRNDKSLSQDQKKEKMKEFRKQQHEQMKSVLNPQQMEKMKSLRKERKPETK